MSDGILTAFEAARLAAAEAAFEAARLAAFEAAFDAARPAAFEAAFDAAGLAELEAARLAAVAATPPATFEVRTVVEEGEDFGAAVIIEEGETIPLPLVWFDGCGAVAPVPLIAEEVPSAEDFTDGLAAFVEPAGAMLALVPVIVLGFEGDAVAMLNLTEDVLTVPGLRLAAGNNFEAFVATEAFSMLGVLVSEGSSVLPVMVD